MTSNPAKILGIKTGELKVGYPADLCLFNPTKPGRVDPDKMKSMTKNTPFDGRLTQGKVRKTFVNGECIYDSNLDQ